MHCRQCGADNRATAKFCDSCGSSLRSEVPGIVAKIARPASASGERRHLTLLFCDLVNSTSIATQLDPEDWREIVANYHHAAAQAIERFGGHVAQYLGDGVMAYFGWPEAHDNNAERAVRAGLAIIDAVSKLNEQTTRPKLSARVGIDSGAVVVGASIDNRAEVFGDTPNISARVQATALPDTVLITADTFRLISGLFVVENRGTHTLKGIEQPLQLYRVIRPSDVQGRLQATAAVRVLTPFIGRDDELRLLMNRWERALEGEPQVVLISGEAGIGKSRLVQRFHQQIAGRSYYWVEGMASPFFHNTPFYPVAGIFRELQARYHNVPDQVSGTIRHQGYGTRTGLSSTNGSNGHSGNGAFSGKDEHQRQLAQSQHLNLTRKLAVAMVALNLSAPAEKNVPSPPPKRRLLSTLVEWVLGVAQVVPLVIAIEDLHWADPSTLELLQLLTEQAASVPLMLLCTARPEFRDEWPPQTHDTRIMLSPLSAHNARTMVVQVAEQKCLTEETIRTVVERTGGVPLFIEELTRAVLETDKLEHARHEIPATLHDSLMARLDRLGPARETLQVGAALGINFTYELLHAVTLLNENELQRHLLVLKDADLLYTLGLPPNASYQFKHALIRDAAYEALLKSRRRELHTRIAQTIEERFPEQTASRPEILAYHYTEAGLIAQAVRYWRKAGQKASERSANVEAIAQLRKALELLKSLPLTPEHLMEEVKLQIALTTPLIATAGYTAPEVEKASSRALELCQQLGETPQLFHALGTLQSIYFNRGELEIALELAKQLLHLAETQQHPVLLLWAHYALGINFASQGAFKLARDHLQRSIALYDERRAGAYGFVQDPGPTAMALLSHVVYSLGYPQQASAKMQTAVAQARSLSHPFTLAWVLGSAGALHWRRGEKLAAQESWAEQAAICSEHGFKALLTLASLRIGFGQVEEGRAEDGLSMMHDAVRSLTDTPVSDDLLALGFFAFALGKVGQLDHGLARIDEALALADKGPNFVTSMLYLRKGELILMKSPSSLRKAKQCFNVAIKIAHNQKAKSDELAASIPLAKLLAQQGRREQARSMLKKI